MSVIAKSNVAGNKPTVNQLLACDTGLGYNRVDALFYGLQVSSLGVKTVVCLGASLTPGQNHNRQHSMVDALDHAPALSDNYNKLVATNATTGAIEYIDKPTALTPADHILDWDASSSKYMPYTAKKATDPGYAYLYTNVAALNYPTFVNRLCVDGILYATQLISGTGQAFAGMMTKMLSLNDVYNGYYNYFALTTADNINKLCAWADVNGTTSQSNPILIGDNSTYHGRKNEHVIVDPANQRFDVNTAKTRFNKGTASKWLALDANKELVYMDATDAFWQRTGTKITPRTAGDTVQLGSDTNNTTFSADGTQKMNGSATVYKKIFLSGLELKLAGNNDPTLAVLAENVLVNTFSGSVMNEAFFSVQMPPEYKEGSPIQPVVHWMPMTSPATDQGITWYLEYQWVNIADNFALSNTVNHVFTALTGTVGFKHLAMLFSEISGTGKTISSVLVGRIHRDPTYSTDNYTGAIGLLGIGFIFESDTLGSNSTYVK